MGGAGDAGEGDVAVGQVHRNAVEGVGPERAARAALGPVGSEHEVVDEQLAAAVEQLAQRAGTVSPVEAIVLVDVHPGQLAALLRQLVAAAG